MSLAAMRARARTHPRPLWRVAVLLVAGAAALYVFGAGFLEWYALTREVARLTVVRRDLQEQNAVLREEMRLLQTPAYIERLAREQLGLVRPGEVAILILRTPAPAPPPPPGRIERDSRSLPARLWQTLRRRLR
jgi:cell division protein FtsB